MEVSTDYSYLRTNSSGGGGSFSANGGSVSAAWKVKPLLGLVADFGGYNLGSEGAGVGGRLYTYTFGPRISTRLERRVWSPFAQVLAGGSHLTGHGYGQSASENGFTLIAGGGLDARLGPHMAIRAVEVNYLMTRLERANGAMGFQNDLRVSSGIVFHFNY